MITLRNLLVRVFNPWLYWKEQYDEAMVMTYHPELGSYWQPKEAGGLYIQQAHDQGYQQGCKDTAKDFYTKLLDHSEAVWEYRALTVRGNDTEAHRVLQALKVLGAESWEVFFMETAHRFKPIGVATDAADELTMYMRREKSSAALDLERRSRDYWKNDPTKYHEFVTKDDDPMPAVCHICCGPREAIIHDPDMWRHHE